MLPRLFAKIRSPRQLSALRPPPIAPQSLAHRRLAFGCIFLGPGRSPSSVSPRRWSKLGAAPGDSPSALTKSKPGGWANLHSASRGWNGSSARNRCAGSMNACSASWPWRANPWTRGCETLHSFHPAYRMPLLNEGIWMIGHERRLFAWLSITSSCTNKK